MAQLESLLSSQLAGDDPFLHEIAHYAFRLGGKRLRPALLFLAGRACGENAGDEIACDKINKSLLHFAAAVELVHAATLIHDDIIDGASVRRHLATMNSRWDAATSVLAGDFLLSEAMRLVTVHDDLEAYRILSDALHRTCRGELRQRGYSGRIELSRETYFTIIGEKTASLLGCSCELGAYLVAQDAATQQTLREFGFQLGLAFQIVDDVLDMEGDETQMGKTLGTDLLQRKVTLPLLIYLENASNAEREFIRAAWNNETLPRETLCSETATAVKTATEIARRVCAANGTQRALQEAEKIVAQAKETLLSLKNLPHETRDTLCTLADFSIARRA